jgi:hypothetical protein
MSPFRSVVVVLPVSVTFRMRHLVIDNQAIGQVGDGNTQMAVHIGTSAVGRDHDDLSTTNAKVSQQLGHDRLTGPFRRDQRIFDNRWQVVTPIDVRFELREPEREIQIRVVLSIDLIQRHELTVLIDEAETGLPVE